jgi:hypothetical protein
MLYFKTATPAAYSNVPLAGPHPNVEEYQIAFLRDNLVLAVYRG